MTQIAAPQPGFGNAFGGVREFFSRTKYLVPLLLFMLAAAAIYSVLNEYRYTEVASALRSVTRHQIARAVVLCILNYLLLTAYDFLGLRIIGKRLAISEVMTASLSSYAVSHTVGFSLLSSAAVRYRFYSRAGISAGEVGIIVVCASTFLWLGFTLLASICAIAMPEAFAFFGASPLFVTSLGAAGLLLIALLVAVPAALRERILGKRIAQAMPSRSLVMAGAVLGALDWFLAAAVLYTVLPGHPNLTLVKVVAAYQAAQTAAILSHVPGGVGVFEAVITLLLAGHHAPPIIFGALVVYRCIYYLIPFLCGISALLISELKEVPALRGWIPGWIVLLIRQSSSVVPVLLSGAVFLSGAIMLFSGSSPTAEDRVWWVEDVLPLSVVEGSHFINSIVGTLLLILAVSIRRRLARAWSLTIVLLLTGSVATFLKGFDYEESAFAILVAVALVLARRAFSRRASVDVPLTPRQLVAVGIAIGAASWLGFFSFRNVSYSNQLWWQFAADADAPRFLRTSVLSAVVIMAIAIRGWLHAKPPKPELPSAGTVEKLASIIATSEDTEANLALLGDKFLLFDETRTSFIMYGISGRTWVSMGDPVAVDQAAREELIWKFREQCDLHGVISAFYEVDASNLPLYVDAGFDLLKIGEQAVVDLSRFSLDGQSKKSLRQGVRRMERDGFQFNVIPREEVAHRMPELRAISDEWLGDKRTREKGFSLGFFSERYLSHFDVAIVTQNGAIIAFANMWKGGGKHELSVDLMRFRPGIHNGIMDFLFTHLMLWGQREGYQRFNLGMAPLAGLPARRMASAWSKVGAYVFRHGEHFYNFQGLRDYKSKFDPEWVPRYLASPGGLTIPVVMANLASLISGGVRGVIGR